MSHIAGKLILITGASSGIGEACARRFAAEGAELVLWARRADRLERLAAELGTEHRVSLSLAVVDVRDRAAVNRAAEALVRAGRVPDILINNAGLASGLAKIHEGDPEDWDRMIDTNLKGLLYVSRAIMPHMVARRRGHVVNIGSTAGHQTYPMGNVYNATKFGVRALTEGLLLVLAARPGGDSGNGPPLPQASSLHVLHAIRGGPSLTVSVDGARGSTLVFGGQSRTFLSPGLHELVLVPSDTSHSLIVDFSAQDGVNYTAFAIDSVAGATHTVEPVIVPDTGSVPAVGHSRLRITSFAAAAPLIDGYRAQPDSPGLLVSA